MGQKVNPHGLRVGIIKDWDSRWYAEKDFGDNLVEDHKIRKFLKNKLYTNVDHVLFRKLNNYIFQGRSLTEIIDEYKNNPNNAKDRDGKKLFSIIDTELRQRRIDRSELIEIIVDYLFETNGQALKKLVDFLKKQMSV